MLNNRPINGGIFKLLCCLFLFGMTTGAATAQTIYALAGQSLIAFDAQNPSILTSDNTITGLLPGHALMGLDFRPATGQLYALGYNSVSGEAELYTIDRNTAVATPIGVPVTLNVGITDIGFDFNPTVDRIRVTGSDGSNYRLHPVTGALVATDTNLSFAPGDINVGVTPTIGASAYANSYIGASSTTLYNYDVILNVFTTQNPPNAGMLNTVGSSGLTLNILDPSVDFDIYFDPATSTNHAFLAANTGGSINDDLYNINLSTGVATLIGAIDTSGAAVRDIAVSIDLVAPAPLTGDLIYAATANNNLISFDSDLPGTIRSSVGITGIAVGQTLSGLDFRPATGQLYALGYNSTNGEARLYTVNLGTGVATAVGALDTLAADMVDVGFDFNPTVDRIRITSSNNNNYRLHPVTAAIVSTDSDLNFAAVDVNAGINPSVVTSAYTNSYSGATTTLLYGYEYLLNILTLQNPPNAGTLTTVGQSGINVNTTDPSADLDIYYDLDSSQNRAYLAANVDLNSNDNLYTVDLANGEATLVGKIGLGIAVRNIAAFLETSVTLACTANVTDTIPFGDSTVAVNYTVPTATTTCGTGGLTVTLLSGPASGAPFTAGSTQVCYVATNACGNVDTCCFTVTVVNAPPPTEVTIVCPANVVDTLAAGDSTVIVNYTLPTATTTCASGGAIVTLLSGPASGSAFAAGVTDVCYVATDSCGNSDTCCFTVTIDTFSTVSVLTLTCTANITDTLAAGDSTIIVNYAIPSATTTCANNNVNITRISGPDSGTPFAAGVTEICFVGTDACGNSDTCCFTVTIDPGVITSLLTLTCTSNVRDTLPAGDSTVIVNYTIPTATTTCASGGVTVTLLSGPASGGAFTPGVTDVCYVATDSCGNSDTCCFTVTIDTFPGTYLIFNCPGNIVDTLAFGSTTIVVDYPTPFVATNCPSGSVTITTISGPPTGSALSAGVYNVCLMATDSCGDVDSCCFTVTIDTAAAPTQVTLNCPANITDTLALGDSTIIVNYPVPTATTTCASGGATVTLLSGPASGSAFTAGNTQVCYSAIDSCGNVDTCCFMVTIDIPVAPTQVTITCPAAISDTIAVGDTSIVVSYALPTATTTCLSGGATVTLLSGPASGSAFTAGVTDVCYVAKDSCGNSDTCCFTVTITAAPPAVLSITCPANIVDTTAAGATTLVVNYTVPSASTNCPGGASVSLLSGPASGSSFVGGNTQVCYVAKDSCGNSDTCCFMITVVLNPAVVTACETKTNGCLKVELISIKKNINGDEVYRMRIVNNCTTGMNYVAFELPQSFNALDPANNAVYTGPSGKSYDVRNPNFQPYRSIRFKTIGTGITGGESDIFEYTLPKITDPAFIHVFVRFANGTSSEVILNTSGCPVLPYVPFGPDDPTNNFAAPHPGKAIVGLVNLYPNPNEGNFMVDLSNWDNQPITLFVHNAMGQLIQRLEVPAGTEMVPFNLVDLNTGIYYLEVVAADGTKQVQRFAVQR